jgi:hypothetical protein
LISGFHFYGADICLHAHQMGHSAYVIDFHLEHLSPGKGHTTAAESVRAVARAGARWMQTTCSLIHLSGDAVRQSLGRVIDWPRRASLAVCGRARLEATAKALT